MEKKIKKKEMSFRGSMSYLNQKEPQKIIFAPGGNPMIDPSGQTGNPVYIVFERISIQRSCVYFTCNGISIPVPHHFVVFEIATLFREQPETSDVLVSIYNQRECFILVWSAIYKFHYRNEIILDFHPQVQHSIKIMNRPMSQYKRKKWT